ncbi:hypothetical protein QYE76_008251 [Lolium multiflorum]|uniref:Uncharacterized protein n=1 Tax=Lolium multiflorum TaxID=4521 RepID=A0AAD8QI70_LOLMU|nr:hypothetical protein QYE76_008251 [Lolium multiflorum]
MHGERRWEGEEGMAGVRVDEDQRRFVVPIVYLYHRSSAGCWRRRGTRTATTRPVPSSCPAPSTISLCHSALVERDLASSSSSSHRVPNASPYLR